MARSQTLDNGTSVKVDSSIALLQERFRQLQRTKEIREERELLRQLLAESEERGDQTQAAAHFEAKDLFCQSEMTVAQHKQQPQVSVFLQPSYLQNKQNYQDIVRRLTSCFDDSDVDTSLHL